MSENSNYPQLDTATTEIEHWNEVRNEEQPTTTIFDNTNSFVLTKEAYEQWKNNSPQHIHAYLTITDTSSNHLSLWCVDSATDLLLVEGNQEQYEENLFEFNCSSELFNPPASFASNLDLITPEEASIAITALVNNKDTWVTQQTMAQTMVQILVIPFSDLTTLFGLPDTQSLIAQFALKGASNALQVDLILWSKNIAGNINYNEPKDLIQPVPPYSGYPNSAFQLLQYAL
jgi:hypothetical protein